MFSMLTVLFAIISTLLILIGLAGIILPFIPGIPLAWLGFFIFAIGTGFSRISILTTVIFFIVMLLTLALDFIAPMLGAKRYKATKWGIAGASLGLIVGIFIFGFWGIILGPFLGAMLGELIAGRETGIALKTAFGTLIGLLMGTLLKIIVVLIMLGFLIASWF
jgi:uncharacterized protein YqgC (DUF456 family)